MTWRLLPGLRLLRRDAAHVQVGLDTPAVVVLPDVPAVRRLVLDLAAGTALPVLDDDTGPALAALVRAGLVTAADEQAARKRARAAYAVHVEAPDDLRPAALDLLARQGLGRTARGAASAALVWSSGEPARERADAWMRSATAHLLVAERPDGRVRIGPFVAPGASACLRCVDAHLRERDPRRDLLVAQAAEHAPLRPPEPDPALRALALGWAVRDLTRAADGARPVTWSASVLVGDGTPELTAYRRHPHCGCAWDEPLAVAAGA